MYVSGGVALLVVIFAILMIVGVVQFSALVVGLLILGLAVAIGAPFVVRT